MSGQFKYKRMREQISSISKTMKTQCSTIPKPCTVASSGDRWRSNTQSLKISTPS